MWGASGCLPLCLLRLLQYILQMPESHAVGHWVGTGASRLGYCAGRAGGGGCTDVGLMYLICVSDISVGVALCVSQE